MMNATFFARFVVTMKNLLFLAVVMFIILIPPRTVHANWMKAYGINAGDINALAMSGGTIFAGTSGSGVFLSANNGTSWTAANNGLQTNTNIVCLAVRGNNIFAGTFGQGVFLSANNGTNWTAVNNGLPANSLVFCLAVRDSNIFAGTPAGSGVFLSSNNGTGWTAVNNSLPVNAAFYSLAVNDSSIFAGTAGGGVFLSTNNGTGWKAAKSGLPATTDIYTLDVCDSTIFAGTNGRGVFLSANNGTTWTAASNGLTDSIVWSMAVDRCLIFAGTQTKGVFLSADDGATWKAINEGLTDVFIRSLAVNDSSIFAGTAGGGVWRRPLSEMVAFTNLTIKQEYVYPPGDNFYDFTWNPVQGAAGYDFYCNNVPFLHVSSGSGPTLTFREQLGKFIDIIESETGKTLNYRDTLAFYLVARSYNNQILGVSYFVRMPFDLYVAAQPPKSYQKDSGIRIGGSLIDCSSLKGTVRIALYSLNGEKVWAKQGVGVKTMVPGHLPRGAYTVEVTGGFGKTGRVIIRE